MGLLSRVETLQQAPPSISDTQAHPVPGERSHASGKAGIPAARPETCPVVGRPVCYYGDCRHWSGAGCAHPSAVSAPLRGDKRNKLGARRRSSAARDRG